jgi:acetyltransferase-like isoleucine patch superfamily enzyme
MSRSGPTLYHLWQRARRKLFSLLVARSLAAFGRGSVIEPPIRLDQTGRIAIGANVYVGAGSWLQAVGDGDEVAIEIGEGSSLAGNCTITAAQSVRIGARVLFARNVYISDHSHRFEDTSRAVLDQGITGILPVEVGDGAWLAQNVVVLPGVRIGRGAVVGANAVVRDDVPDYALAVGAPARVVREFAPHEAPTG